MTPFFSRISCAFISCPRQPSTEKPVKECGVEEWNDKPLEKISFREAMELAAQSPGKRLKTPVISYIL